MNKTTVAKQLNKTSMVIDKYGNVLEERFVPAGRPDTSLQEKMIAKGKRLGIIKPEQQQ